MGSITRMSQGMHFESYVASSDEENLIKDVGYVHTIHYVIGLMVRVLAIKFEAIVPKY